MGREPEGHPPREAGKRLIIQGDKLSQLLRGSSLADCEVKTELSETGKALSLLLYFSTRIFFFLIWKCSWGAGRRRLENSRGLRGERLLLGWDLGLILISDSPSASATGGSEVAQPRHPACPPPRGNTLAFSLVFTALRGQHATPCQITLTACSIHRPHQPPCY